MKKVSSVKEETEPPVDHLRLILESYLILNEQTKDIIHVVQNKEKEIKDLIHEVSTLERENDETKAHLATLKSQSLLFDFMGKREYMNLLATGKIELTGSNGHLYEISLDGHVTKYKKGRLGTIRRKDWDGKVVDSCGWNVGDMMATILYAIRYDANNFDKDKGCGSITIGVHDRTPPLKRDDVTNEQDMVRRLRERMENASTPEERTATREEYRRYISDPDGYDALSAGRNPKECDED